MKTLFSLIITILLLTSCGRDVKIISTNEKFNTSQLLPYHKGDTVMCKYHSIYGWEIDEKWDYTKDTLGSYKKGVILD